MSSGGDGALVEVDGFGDKIVKVRTEHGVWRELIVTYRYWHENNSQSAIFDDKRCEHVRKLCLSHIEVDVVNKLARLVDLEELTAHYLHGFAPPPGIWPQLRRLHLSGPPPTHETVLSLMAAAPNVRELSVVWTHRLHCLPAILAGLPILETLRVDYVYVDGKKTGGADDTLANANLVDCEQLDNVTPHNLVSMRLHKGNDSDKEPTASLVELAAALVRMQGRAHNRFTIELCGKRF